MKNKIVIGIIAVIALVGIWGVSSYNRLAKANLAVDTQWAQVETQYQRRFDLIPNLVASVQGIFTQEKDVFIAIAEARKGYSGAKSVDEKAAAAGQMESALGRLLVITENYPQLNSNQTLQNLMAQLEGTENRVSVERTRYNDVVASYNAQIITFPYTIVAPMLGFKQRAFFKADDKASTAPAVKFNQ
jgi:LemA protein